MIKKFIALMINNQQKKLYTELWLNLLQILLNSVYIFIKQNDSYRYIQGSHNGPSWWWTVLWSATQIFPLHQQSVIIAFSTNVVAQVAQNSAVGERGKKLWKKKPDLFPLKTKKNASVCQQMFLVKVIDFKIFVQSYNINFQK